MARSRFVVPTLVVFLAACSGSTQPDSSQPGRTPALIGFASPSDLAADVGTEVDSVPKIRLVDASNQPVPGLRVTFEITGGGSVRYSTATTWIDGTATPQSWKMGPTAGLNTLTARAGNLSVTFTSYAIDPAEQPISRYQLAEVNGRVGPYTSGWRGPGAVSNLNGTLELYSRHFVRTYNYFSNPSLGSPDAFVVKTRGQYNSIPGGAHLAVINLDVMLRGDSMLVPRENLPDNIIVSSVYLKQ